MVFAALIGGLVGSRLDYVLQNWSEGVGRPARQHLLRLRARLVRRLVGGALGVILWARWRLTSSGGSCSPRAVPLAIGYAIGRVGCQLSGDGDSASTPTCPWAMSVSGRDGARRDTVHPTPVYETLAMGLVAVVLWRLRDRFAPGVLFGLYRSTAGLERFLVEFVRRNEAVVAGLTQPQLISLVLMALGAAILAVRARVPRAATA